MAANVSLLKAPHISCIKSLKSSFVFCFPGIYARYPSKTILSFIFYTHSSVVALRQQSGLLK